MCQFQQLYFDDDGYVVCCNECGHYQIAYTSIALTLSPNDFKVFCKIVQRKSLEPDYSLAEKCKSVIIHTPCKNINLLLTRKEVIRFNEILEEADTEATAISLINMFNA